MTFSPAPISATQSNADLSIRWVAPYKYPEISRILSVWAEIAQSKQSEAQGRDAQIFFDSRKIIQWTKDYLRGAPDGIEVYVSENKVSEMEGLLIFSRYHRLPNRAGRHLGIETLFTHPKNIRSPINDLEERCPGVGSMLIAFAEAEAMENGFHGVFLGPFRTAIPFYEKMRYEALGKTLFKPMKMPQNNFDLAI